MSHEHELVDRQAKYSLRLLGQDPPNWVIPTAGVDRDVLIVGGGQSGVCLGYALRRAGIGNVSIIDEAEEGKEGVWLTKARMLVLRTPKSASGPELGNPSLSFQAWYEGLYGEAAYAAIGRIKREDWAQYLKWYQTILNVPVRYRTRLRAVEPEGSILRLRLLDNGVERTETARKVVFANGMSGTGGPFIPKFISEALPKEYYSHTAEDIDFESLRGKSIAVIGAATSAFDVSATALERGAGAVHLFSRRSDITPAAGAGPRAFQGIQENYHLLPDAERWRFQHQGKNRGSNSPFDSVLRPTRHPNFRLHFNSAWQNLREEGGRVAFEDNGEPFVFDHVIVATGYQYDPHTRPELQKIVHDIALWRDRYTPPEEEASEALGAYPYLGHAYEFLEKVPGSAPYLRNVHAFNMGASLSFGRPVADIPGLRFEVPRLVAAISRDLLLDDLASYRRFFQDTPEFDPKKYRHAIWKRAPRAEDAANPAAAEVPT